MPARSLFSALAMLAIAKALSAPAQKVGGFSLQTSAPFRVLKTLPATDWPAPEHCTRFPGVMGTWLWNELMHMTLDALTPGDCLIASRCCLRKNHLNHMQIRKIHANCTNMSINSQISVSFQDE